LIPKGEKSDPSPTWRWYFVKAHLEGVTMKKETLAEACQLLEDSTDSVYASSARLFLKLFDDFDRDGYLEDEAQHSEARLVFTALTLFDLCSAAMWGDLTDQPPGDVFTLGEYLYTHGASDALLQICQTLPADSLDETSMQALRDTYWQRISRLAETPRANAWRRAADLISQALQDPAVRCNTATCDYLALMLDHARQATPIMDARGALEPVFRKARSESGQKARLIRTQSADNPIRDKALELYDAKKWSSVRKAATEIFGNVQAFAETNGRRLSEDRFPQTLHEWIAARKRGNDSTA
jgi:hypothetical protein